MKSVPDMLYYAYLQNTNLPKEKVFNLLRNC